MGNLVILHDVMARALARELGVSINFIETCQGLGVSVPHSKSLLRWFLTRPRAERMIVMKAMLREATSDRSSRRVKALARKAAEDDPDPVITRATFGSSWRNAQRLADVDGVVKLTPASYVGQLLEATNGDAHMALALLPDAIGPFWGTVRSYLQHVARGEGG
jgi:hypothetical protein